MSASLPISEEDRAIGRPLRSGGCDLFPTTPAFSFDDYVHLTFDMYNYPVNPTLPLAISAGKLTRDLTKVLHIGGGTAPPGLGAETIEPQILAHPSGNFQ